MPDAFPPENEFLNTLRKESKRVSFFLVSGIKLTGVSWRHGGVSHRHLNP
ncbi:RNA chaperone Hfq [Caballeronia sp. LP003]|nr:RNA chaperone Hfq [Caballeronia sp. LP003]